MIVYQQDLRKLSYYNHSEAASEVDPGPFSKDQGLIFTKAMLRHALVINPCGARRIDAAPGKRGKYDRGRDKSRPTKALTSQRTPESRRFRLIKVSNL
ncbi:MAG TPA: hypothetical protein VIV66_03335 [Pyrinomonadaceae bacterium]